jgi:ribosome-associated toxin RatA of RatAB toxin-antitoxin module
MAGHDISVSGNRATARANLVAMNIIHATFVRADGKWKISQMSNNVTRLAAGF